MLSKNCFLQYLYNFSWSYPVMAGYVTGGVETEAPACGLFWGKWMGP